jgi:Iron-sulfur cluster assembly accessory protein
MQDRKVSNKRSFSMNALYPMQAPENYTATLHITQSALERLKELRSQEKNQEQNQEQEQDVVLRITVLSGGCSGFQYKFAFEKAPGSEDLCFSYDGVQVITDEISYELLKEVTLDYVQELIGAAFTLRNPNATNSCGCGNSFSI